MSKPTYNSETKIWSGPNKRAVYNSDQSIGQLSVNIFKQSPEIITQVSADTNVSVTCYQMRIRILKFAKHLMEFGYKEGDIIGIVASNSENLAPAIYACLLLGLPVNPVAISISEKDMIRMYSKTKPKMIICDAKNIKTIQSMLNSMKSDAQIYTVMEKLDGFECVSEILNMTMSDNEIKNFVAPNVDPNSLALILYSSASTGLPKRITKTHKELIENILPIHDSNQSTSPIAFQVFQISWMTGMFIFLTSTFYGCTRVITSEDYQSERFAEILEKYKVNFIVLPPTISTDIVENKNLKTLHHLRTWLIVGYAPSKSLCEKAKKLAPNALVSSAYGCTEANVLSSNAPDGKYESCGYIEANLDLKITDDSGKALNNYEKGEIFARRATNFAGYFGNIEKTQESFDGDFFKTGDIGYIDDDGLLYFVGRKKEILSYNGYTFTPSELEIIIDNIEGVKRSCVAGVLDENSNHILYVFAIVNESSELTENFVRDFVNGKVIDEMQIRGDVHFVKSLPCILNTKVDRAKVTKMAENLFKEKCGKYNQ